MRRSQRANRRKQRERKKRFSKRAGYADHAELHRTEPLDLLAKANPGAGHLTGERPIGTGLSQLKEQNGSGARRNSDCAEREWVGRGTVRLQR